MIQARVDPNFSGRVEHVNTVHDLISGISGHLTSGTSGHAPGSNSIQATGDMTETLKRKRGAQDFVPTEGKGPNVKPTRVCSTGKDAKAAIESGSKDGKLERRVIPDCLRH